MRPGFVPAIATGLHLLSGDTGGQRREYYPVVPVVERYGGKMPVYEVKSHRRIQGRYRLEKTNYPEHQYLKLFVCENHLFTCDLQKKRRPSSGFIL